MSDILGDLVKVSGNEYGGVAEDGIQSADVKEYIDTGSLMLNALVSGSLFGGVPNNKRLQFAGSSGVGKTFFTLGIIKFFLDSDPENRVVLFETESAITKDMLQQRGIDTKRILILPVTTVEEFRTQAVRILNKIIENGVDKNKIMLGLDSLGMLSTNKEVADTESGSDKRDMTRSQLIKGAFRVITLRLGMAEVPLIMTNHTYQEMGLFPKTVASGGSGAYYASDNIILLTKAKEKSGTDIIGNVITCTNHKSRLTIENKKVKVLVTYKGGLDRYYGLVDFACDNGIFKKVSTRIELPDGSKMFAKQIYKEPEKYFTKEILEKLDECARNEFLYGKTNLYGGDDVEEASS